MKSVTSFFMMIVLVSGIVFCLSSSIVVITAATATAKTTKSVSGVSVKRSTTPTSISHNKNIKPTNDDTALLLQAKTYLNKATQILLQHGDKQTAILHLKAANNKLTSTHIASVSSGHSNEKSIDISFFQSVKTSTKNAIQALQSHNNMIALQAILYLKTANSKLSSILSTFSPTETAAVNIINS